MCKVEISILKDYLTDREVSLEFAGVTVSKFLSCGCPQGGVLSPPIWNLYIDSLLRLLVDLGVDVQGWADDIVVGFQVHNSSFFDQIPHIIKILEKNLSWGRTFKASFNASKTHMVLFNKPNSELSKLNYFFHFDF